MNLRDLEYIIAVADLGSFSRAAKSCHVSQPSLSTQVRKVEDQLGVEIFVRGRRQVRLTPVGEQVFSIAKEILGLQQKLEAVGEESQTALSGTIRLGGILTVAPYVFARVLGAARKEAPELQLSLKEGKTEELLADLIDGNLDAALVALPTDENVFEGYSLFLDNFSLALRKDHPLANSTRLEREALAGERLILLEEGHCFREQALSVCKEFDGRELSEIQADSFETIRTLVAAGEGITLMPAIAKAGCEKLAYVDIEGDEYTRDIGIIWRKNSKEKQKLGKLRDLLVGELSQGEQH